MCFWYNYHSNTLFSCFIYLGNFLHFLHPGKLFFDLCKRGYWYFLGGTECERFGFGGQLYEVIRASTFSKSGEKSWTFCLKVCGFHGINLFYYGKSFDSWTTKQGFAGTRAPFITNISCSVVLSPFWIFPTKHPRSVREVWTGLNNVLSDSTKVGVGRSALQILSGITVLKVKNDHRSKFSNLSNWKKEAWKKSGFNGIRTRDLCVGGALLYQLSYEATHWERGQFIEFISPVIISYTSHHFTPHGRYKLNKLTSLPMCGFIAQLVEQRTGNAEVTGSNPVEALIFFRLLLSNCLNLKIYCDDHSSLSSTTAIQKWIISYTSH